MNVAYTRRATHGNRLDMTAKYLSLIVFGLIKAAFSGTEEGRVKSEEWTERGEGGVNCLITHLHGSTKLVSCVAAAFKRARCTKRALNRFKDIFYSRSRWGS